MKISYNWLKEYLNIALSPRDVAELLTSSGLEVESFYLFENIRGGLKQVVIGEVTLCEKHPNADKLSVTKVNVGSGDELQIVCGAPNVSKGQKVVVALEGAELYPLGSDESLKIKSVSIRGVLSQGMICSAKELGISAEHNGIMILPENVSIGLPASEFFGLYTDVVFEIGLTPNRGDAFSHIGVARDLKAVLNVRQGKNLNLKLPRSTSLPFLEKSSPISVEILNTEKCIRYSGLLINNVKVQESPAWLKNRLSAIGVRSINNVVDITNFVLHEFGQPLHAFDADKINNGKVIVRDAKPGENFIALDGTARRLHGSELMICDPEGPMCMAGIFGGANSGVTAQTRHVFLESACFSPASIRKSAALHQLRTDAAQRFEKGCDPQITITALLRAATLLAEIAGGEIKYPVVDVYPKEIKPAQIRLTYSYLRKICGFDISVETTEKIFEQLDLYILEKNNEGWLLSAPTYRADVLRPADVAEEVLRIYGYNNFPVPERMQIAVVSGRNLTEHKLENELATILNGIGFTEISTNSITRAQYEQNEHLIHQQVKLLNSQTSELNCMRTSMLYGMLEAVVYNQNRKINDLSLYEFGKTYHKMPEGYMERKHLALLLCGHLRIPNWITREGKANLYHLKGVMEQLFVKSGIRDFNFHDCELIPYFNAFRVEVKQREIAHGGMVSSSLKNYFDLKQDVYFAVIDFDFLLDAKYNNQVFYAPVPRYPSVKRDLALIVNHDVNFSQIVHIAREQASELLTEVSLFDVYTGNQIPEGKKSYAVSFVFCHPEKTLTDEETDQLMQSLISAFEKQIGAEIRK
ncbi:MAG: phenylalanine--tRNA ligase subunit beta [Chitinophagales bacterium]|nr:phenylalanine--tRNA ligase subunit beta [Chitinophagales bacterium]MDW8274238.1 phenylalanine--tRNA ligase subunit beta [Chitinophagales bacterium]